jgi:C-terminal processing protease CtpA/Prc
MKLTTARCYTPAGRCIDRSGILPDVVVASSEPPVADAQLAAAVAVIGGTPADRVLAAERPK